MIPKDIEEILLIENKTYEFPWTKGNFLDSFNENYVRLVLRNSESMIIGYFILMKILNEGHLLNLTIRLDMQGQGYGKFMLNEIFNLTKKMNLKSIFLEVRKSNKNALAIYKYLGFKKISIRKGYYPKNKNIREDAVIMCSLI